MVIDLQAYLALCQTVYTMPARRRHKNDAYIQGSVQYIVMVVT